MNLSLRSTPYHQWLVERRAGRKRKVLGRFGDEKNARTFLASLTRGTEAHVSAKDSLHGHRARAGATPAAGSNLDPVAQLVEQRPSMSHVPSSSLGGVTNLPTVESGLGSRIRSRQSPHHAATKTACMTAIVVGLALALPSTTKAADGGHSISAGSGVVSVSEAGLKPPATSTGPAESFSVASGIRPEAIRNVDLLGYQGGNRTEQSTVAVSHGRFSSPAPISPTEFNVHPPAGFSRPASGLAWDDGVGNGSTRVSDTARPQPIAGGGHFSPAVGGNQTARQMPGSPGESVRREETDGTVLNVGEFASRLFDNKRVVSGIDVWLGCDLPSYPAPFLGNQDGAPSSGASKSRNTDAASVSVGENPAFSATNYKRLFAFVIVTASVCASLLAIASCALSGRLEDPR